MIQAFALVTAWSFRNRILLRLRRLREPRYLLSFLAGLAYFWFMVFRRMHRSGGSWPGIAGTFQPGELGRDLVSIILLAFGLLAWAFPGQTGGLELSEGEIQFLFPAPLSRRQLLLYKLFRSVPQMLFSAAIMTFFGFRQAMFAGLVAGFGTMNVYLLMVAQARARLKLAGIGMFARWAAVLIIGAGLFWFFHHEAGSIQLQPALRAMKSGHAQPMIDAADAPFQKPAVRTLLFLPHLFANVLFPRSITHLAVSSLALLALGFLFFLIAARLNVSFEDASVAISQRRVERLLNQGTRGKGRRVAFSRFPAPFRMASEGPPEVAIIWKNLTAAMRSTGPLLLLLLLPITALVIQAIVGHNEESYVVGGSVTLFFSALFPIIGAGAFRHDLRLDLSRMEVLKGYPLTGERLVAAELVAPLILVSIGELMLLGATALILQLGTFPHNRWLLIFSDPKVLTLALLFAIPVCAANLILRNGAAILLPAWTSRSKEEPRGIIMTGQKILILAANVLLLTVTLLPSALILGVGLWVSQRYFSGSPVALAFAAAPALVLLCAEVCFGIKLLGAQFDRIDVSTEMTI